MINASGNIEANKELPNNRNIRGNYYIYVLESLILH